MGRPSDFTQELADSICSELAAGAKLTDICESADMPTDRTVYRWLALRPEFCQQYARAQEDRTSAMAEDILEIADKATPEDVPGARLRVDTRKWLMSKMAPKKYGDKITQEQTGPNGGPIIKQHITERRIIHIHKGDGVRDSSSI